jgi:hypothetical protein
MKKRKIIILVTIGCFDQFFGRFDDFLPTDAFSDIPHNDTWG